MSKVYIGVGGNLGNVIETIHSAFDVLKQNPKITSVIFSSFYESQPLAISGAAPQDEQPAYINLVAAIETLLSPDELLSALQEIELQFGRIRTSQQWASRTLDLDILLFDDLQLSSERLTIPHPEMLVRDFVLTPLFEIASELNIAGYGSLAHALNACVNRGLKKLSV